MNAFRIVVLTRSWFVRSASLLALFATVLVSSLAQATAIDDLRQFSIKNTAARGEFTQTVVTRSGQAGKTTEGDFSFSRPGKFHWTIRKPFEQRIVSDGNKLYLYDVDLAQVTIRPLGEALSATPAALLFGPQNLDTLFDLKADATVEGIDWVVATPKSKDSQFARIRVGFAGKWPVQMELLDSLGQLTRLNFRNWRGADSVEQDAFRFSPPAGADVIDATQAVRRPARGN
jgi:outer membrane lipoprotein carrier protein